MRGDVQVPRPRTDSGRGCRDRMRVPGICGVARMRVPGTGRMQVQER